MRKRTTYFLATAILFPILEAAGAECDQHGSDKLAEWLGFAADIVKLELLVLLPVFLIGVSRRTVRRRAVCVFVVALLFPIFQKTGIECSQHGFALAGSCLVAAANLLKVAFLVLLIVLLIGLSRLHPDRWVQALLGVLCLPVFLAACATTLSSGRIILNASRPTRPDLFMRDQAALSRLMNLASEMIEKQHDYVFCERGSRILRRIGFDHVRLYPEHNVVQFQMCDFLGWDSGWRYVYYFSPTGTLPEDFAYNQQLDADWYFARRPRFPD